MSVTLPDQIFDFMFPVEPVPRFKLVFACLWILSVLGLVAVFVRYLFIRSQVKKSLRALFSGQGETFVRIQREVWFGQICESVRAAFVSACTTQDFRVVSKDSQGIEKTAFLKVSHSPLIGSVKDMEWMTTQPFQED